jgi:hypothetical protein
VLSGADLLAALAALRANKRHFDGGGAPAIVGVGVAPPLSTAYKKIAPFLRFAHLTDNHAILHARQCCTLILLIGIG